MFVMGRTGSLCSAVFPVSMHGESIYQLCSCYLTANGTCFQVSVKFDTTPATAVSGVDYVVTSDRVTLADGETSKLVPITLVNSAVPRLQRYFAVNLLNETTGGAVIGTPSTSTIIIDETDDAHGVFGKMSDYANCLSFCECENRHGRGSNFHNQSTIASIQSNPTQPTENLQLMTQPNPNHPCICIRFQHKI